MTETAKRDTIWSVPFVVLLVSNFFQGMAAFMTNTTLPVYADAMGADAPIVGMVVGAFAVTALLVRPFGGPAFDSFSRKWLLVLAQGIIAVSLVGYAMVGSVQAIIAVRLLHGVGIGCAGPLAMSLVAEFLPEGRMASGVSVYTLGQTFAQVLGPAVGLWLVDAVGFSTTYLLAALSLVLAMAGMLLVKEPPRDRLPYRFALNRMFAREAVSKAAALCLFAIAFSGVTGYLVLYGNLLGIQGIGAYFVVYALCLVATRPLFGTLADRFGAERVLLVGIACFAVSYVMLWQVRDFAGLMAVAVVGSAGYGACAPLVQSLALSSAPPERRGAASNTSYTGLDLGCLLGPVSAGFVIQALVPVTGDLLSAYSTMWLVMLVPLAGALAVVLRWNFHRTKG